MNEDFFKIFRPDVLREFVDAICDWDVPDTDVAITLAIKQMPSTSLLLILPYRKPCRTHWGFGQKIYSTETRLAITQIRAGAVHLQPTGPFGVVIVCLKPEGAARITGIPISEFFRAQQSPHAYTQIDLSDVVRVREAALLEEMLAEAKNSRERIAAVSSFLRGHTIQQEPDLACRAAGLLRRKPWLPVWRVASDLDVSRRHLLRRFQDTFGTNPKQFARIARVEKVLRARIREGSWSSAAFHCGFADQSHMIKEFSGVVGHTPQGFCETYGKFHTYHAGFGANYLISSLQLLNHQATSKK